MAPEPGSARTRLDRGCPERFSGLRNQLGVTTFGLNQMVLQPGQRGRIHRHARQEEVYLVIEGELTVSIEGEPQTLVKDDLLRVGPELKRQLSNRGGERVVFIALGGATEHEGRDGEAFESWEQVEGAPPQDVPLPEDLSPGQ